MCETYSVNVDFFLFASPLFPPSSSSLSSLLLPLSSFLSPPSSSLLPSPFSLLPFFPSPSSLLPPPFSLLPPPFPIIFFPYSLLLPLPSSIQIFHLLCIPQKRHGGKPLFQMSDLADKRYEAMLYLFRLCYRVIQHCQLDYRKNQVGVSIYTFLVWFLQFDWMAKFFPSLVALNDHVTVM